MTPRAVNRGASKQRPARGPADDRPAPELPPGGGLLLVDKPSGCTSHDVVGRLRYVLRTRRIGHAGTLDPMATGLLVLAVDRSTKLLGHLALTDKTYLGTIRLGQQTDSDDADGLVVASATVDGVTDDAIHAGVAALTGPLLQVPSSVSAIKVDGRRAYDLVRSGETVELAARPVTVSRFEILGLPSRITVSGSGRPVSVIDLDVAVDCTTGTYIRSLARDLGAALGVGGHLKKLQRTRVGPFSIENAVDVFGPADPAPNLPPDTDPAAGLADLDEQPVRSGVPRSTVTVAFAEAIARSIIPATQAVREAFDVRVVDESQALDLRHGRPIPSAGIAGVYGTFDPSGALVALVAERDGATRSVLGWQTAG